MPVVQLSVGLQRFFNRCARACLITSLDLEVTENRSAATMPFVESENPARPFAAGLEHGHSPPQARLKHDRSDRRHRTRLRLWQRTVSLRDVTTVLMKMQRQ